MHAFALDPETGDIIKKFELPISFESETEQDRRGVTDAAGYDEATLTELREDGVLSGDDWTTYTVPDTTECD